jgi:hypothetical protein
LTSTLLPHVYLLREGPAVHVTWRAPAAKDPDVVFHQPQGRARVSADLFLEAVTEFLQWCAKTVAERDSMLKTEIEQWLGRRPALP